MSFTYSYCFYLLSPSFCSQKVYFFMNYQKNLSYTYTNLYEVISLPQILYCFIHSDISHERHENVCLSTLFMCFHSLLVKWRIKTEYGMGKKEENTLILFQLHAHKDIMMNQIRDYCNLLRKTKKSWQFYLNRFFGVRQFSYRN